MKFCPNCNNKYYQIEDDGILIWNCKNCGNKEDCTDFLIDKKNYKTKNIAAVNVRDIIYDPSYPRTNIKQCPNDNCPSRSNKDLQECIILTGVDLKHFFVCTICRTQWG